MDLTSRSLRLTPSARPMTWLQTGLLITLLTTIPVMAGGNGAFSDQTSSVQLSASYSPGNVHGFHGGGAVGDFNGDGWQDVFYPAGGNTPDKLFINNGDGTFTDQAAAWNIALAHRSTAAAVGDFDRDGRHDIYVTSLGPAANNQVGFHKLYRNNGNGTFTDIAVAAGVNQSSAVGADGWGAAWGDYDLDGDLDLAVAGWSTNDGNRLFRNDGNSTFTDVTTSAGLASLAGTNGFAPRFVDMDGDRYPEIIWIGDFASGHYYANNADGTFNDVTGSSNTNQDGTEMGMTVADWDEDGDFDFYVTTINTNNLYLNQGGNTYTNVAPAAGVDNTGWGWATAAIDFNHDSLVDIVATAQGGRNYAFVNTTVGGGPLQFSEVGTTNGLGISIDGRGLANFDYDNDGDQDVIVFPSAGSVKVMRNDLSGPDTNWLRIFLDRGTAVDIAPDGVGAVIEVHVAGRVLLGRIDGGSNYLSQSEMSAHFGLGDATTIDQVRVLWPNGAVSVFTNLTVNDTWTLGPNPPLFRDGFESGDLSHWIAVP